MLPSKQTHWEVCTRMRVLVGPKAPYWVVRIIEMSTLKDKISRRKEEISENTKDLLADFESRTKQFQRSVNAQLKAVNDQFSILRDRISALVRKIDEESRERSRLDAVKAVELETKYGEMRDAASEVTAKTVASCSAVQATTQKWREILQTGLHAFQSILSRLNATAPDHYLREADKQEEDLHQREAKLRASLSGFELELRRKWGETEAMRTAAVMQLDDMCRRSSKVIDDKRKATEQRVAARNMELTVQLQKTATLLGLHC